MVSQAARPVRNRARGGARTFLRISFLRRRRNPKTAI